MTIQKEKMIIGREGEQSFPITDQTVSRSHLIMTREPNEDGMRYFIETVNSRQVLRVDGLFMEKAILTPKSIVEIGPNFYKIDVIKLFDDFSRIYDMPNPVKSDHVSESRYSMPIDLPKGPQLVEYEDLKKTFPKEEVDISHLHKLKTQMGRAESEYERNCSMIGKVEKCCYVGCILLLGITFKEGDNILLSLILRVLVFGAFIGLSFVMKLRLTKKFRLEYEQKMKNLALKLVCPKCNAQLSGDILPGCCSSCKVVYK